MTIPLAPPPLQIPPDFAVDPLKGSFFNGLITTLYQLWTSVYNIRNDANITTEDDSITRLFGVNTDSNRSYLVSAYIVARRTGGSAGSVGDSAWYVLNGGYKNIDGTLSAIGVPSLFGDEDVSAWNVGFSTTGTQIDVTVKGDTNYDVAWRGTISVYEVGA